MITTARRLSRATKRASMRKANWSRGKPTTAGSSMGVAPSFIDGAVKGAFDTGYAFPNARIAHQATDSLDWLVSGDRLAVFHNAFFTESFMGDSRRDRAGSGGFSRVPAGGQPAHLRVLRRAAELSGWGQPSAPAPDGSKTARGIAVHPASAAIDRQHGGGQSGSDQIRYTGWSACSIAVSAQSQSDPPAIGRALYLAFQPLYRAELQSKKARYSRATSINTPRFECTECPVIEINIIRQHRAPGGIGETGTPLSPLLSLTRCFALTGQRLRSLPLKLS